MERVVAIKDVAWPPRCREFAATFATGFNVKSLGGCQTKPIQTLVAAHDAAGKQATFPFLVDWNMSKGKRSLRHWSKRMGITVFQGRQFHFGQSGARGTWSSLMGKEWDSNRDVQPLRKFALDKKGSCPKSSGQWV